MWKFVGVVCVAVLLAAVAPLMGAGEGPMLPAALPWPQFDVSQLSQVAGGLLAPLLAMAFLLLQCLLIVVLVMPLRPLLRRLVAVLRPLRHGLFGGPSWRARF